MLIVIELSLEALQHPPSLLTLAETAAQHEVVLVCPAHAAADGAAFALRRALPRHELVAILVDEAVAHHERRLVEELLNDGAVPLLLVFQEPAPAAVTAWLLAEARLSLPAEAGSPGPQARSPTVQEPEPAEPSVPPTIAATRSGRSSGSR
jgi:hypothetical protein